VDGRPTKVSFNAKTGKKASSTDPSTWSSFEVDYQAFESGDFLGIGFVFGSADEFC
jgi:primase-polymerase (primpol)-like protein